MDKEFQNKYFWIETRGNSMAPLIKEGERLLIEARPPSQMKAGDIIAIKSQKGIIVHRLIRKSKKKGEFYFQEKGDRNVSGRIVMAEDILGKVVFIKGRCRDKNLNRPGWRLYNKMVALYGCFIFSLYRLFKKLRKGP